MGPGRYLVIVALSMLLAMPVVAQTASPSKSPPPAATGGGKTAEPSTTTGSQAQGGLVDINSASAEELDKLPGVGPARVKAIIAKRPYNGKDDLTPTQDHSTERLQPDQGQDHRSAGANEVAAASMIAGPNEDEAVPMRSADKSGVASKVH